MTGLVLAFVGIGLLVAWRTGALSALLGGDLYGAESGSEAQRATGLRGAADTLVSRPAVSIVRSPQSPGSTVASGGTPSDSYSSTIAPIIVDQWGPGGYRDESARAARVAIGVPVGDSIAAAPSTAGDSAMLSAV